MNSNTTRDESTGTLSLEAPREEIHVLLVASESEWRDTLTKTLTQNHGLTVTEVSSATAALDSLDSTRRFECLVAEYDLAEMNGIELLATVKADDGSLPFVLCLDGQSDGIVERALRIGADDVVQRPADRTLQLLANRIENCVAAVRHESSLQTLQQAVENAGHAMLITERDGTITYANPAMANVSGYDVEELRGQTPALLKSGAHDDAFYDDLWETVLDGEVWQGEVINEDKSGDRYVIDQTISPIADASGHITGFVAINREVSRRKQRERNLAFFQQAVEQIGTGMAAYDESGTIQYANPAYAEMLGATPEALNGMHVATLNPEFNSSKFEGYWTSFGDGETRKRETAHRRLDDDTEFPVETVTTRLTIDGEKYHVGTIRDISDRKYRERELRLFRNAVEHAGHAVLITDDEGVITYTNPAFEDISGYTREEASGKTPAIVQSGDHDEGFYEEMWETITDGDVWEGEIVDERKDGDRYHIEQTIAPLKNETGEITHFVGIANDITEMKEYEKELERQNERLENFGRTVAHDLRNPLNVLRMRLEEARSEDDPKQAHDQIADAIDRMETLIDELLMLAKQGQTVLDPEPASLGDVARDAWRHVDTAAMCLSLVDEPTILMDDSRVVEVCENLFRNAREHAGPDATIRIGALEDGFYVADDGPGIPEQDRDRVLESGFTTSKEGTGFGLSIVSQIAEAHDWEVGVSDSDAGGAQFEFRNVTFAQPASAAEDF